MWTHLSYGRWTLIHSAAGISIKYSGPQSPAIYPMLWSREPLPSQNEHPRLGTINLNGYWHPALFEAPGFFRGNGQMERIFGDEKPLGNNLWPRNAAEAHFDDHIWANSPGSLALYLPHWLLILAFLLPWSAFLLWRSRRMHRIPA
jgi:hypothetical protein